MLVLSFKKRYSLFWKASAAHCEIPVKTGITLALRLVLAMKVNIISIVRIVWHYEQKIPQFKNYRFGPWVTSGDSNFLTRSLSQQSAWLFQWIRPGDLQILCTDIIQVLKKDGQTDMQLHINRSAHRQSFVHPWGNGQATTKGIYQPLPWPNTWKHFLQHCFIGQLGFYPVNLKLQKYNVLINNFIMLQMGNQS